MTAVAALPVITSPSGEHVRRRALERFRNRLNVARPGGNGQPAHTAEFSRGGVGNCRGSTKHGAPDGSGANSGTFRESWF